MECRFCWYEVLDSAMEREKWNDEGQTEQERKIGDTRKVTKCL